MGILLSKPDEELVLEKDGTTTRKNPKRRKRGRPEDMGTTDQSRKRGRKSSQYQTTSAIDLPSLDTDMIIHIDTSIQRSGSTSDSTLNTSDSLDLAPQCRKRSHREMKGPSDNSAAGVPKAETESQSRSGAMTTPSIARRKREAPTSPYFKAPAMQLSSPPATPTPSEKSLKKMSKISIIEMGPMPSSLPHFRPTSSEEFGLIQEKLRHEPWKMLVAVIFLNVTTAKMALPLLGQLFERWPNPEALSNGSIAHSQPG